MSKGIRALMALITLPIWYFIMYTVLSAIHVDRLVWFLFWVYVPMGMVLTIAEKLATDK